MKTYLRNSVVAVLLLVGAVGVYAQERTQLYNVIVLTYLDFASGVLTSARLATGLSDETGTGVAVFGTTPTLTTPVLGAATGTSVVLTGAIRSSSATAGIGYNTGAGCAVTQITNRTTGVTCAGLSGAITTVADSAAVEVGTAFTVTDTAVAVGDVVVASIRSGSNSGNTTVTVTTVAAGSFALTVSDNNAAGGTAETGAIIINFVVLKGVSS